MLDPLPLTNQAALFSGASVSEYEFIPSRPRAGLVIVHGIGEHAGRYRHVGEALSRQGIACFAYDLRGHGRAGGRRTHVDNFAEFADDLKMLLDRVRREHADLPMFVWGHSMGSVITILTATSGVAGIKGFITSGCALDALTAFDGLRGLGLSVANALFPGLRINLGSDATLLTQVESAQRRHMADPLITRTASLRLLHGLAVACRTCSRQVRHVDTAWLAIHGEADVVCPVSGSVRLIASLGSLDKTLVVYPGLLHEPHNENEAAQVQMFDLMSNWILRRSR